MIDFTKYNLRLLLKKEEVKTTMKKTNIIKKTKPFFNCTIQKTWRTLFWSLNCFCIFNQVVLEFYILVPKYWGKREKVIGKEKRKKKRSTECILTIKGRFLCQ